MQKLDDVIKQLQPVVDSGDIQKLAIDIQAKIGDVWEWKDADYIKKFWQAEDGVKHVKNYLENCQKQFADLDALPKYWIMRFADGVELKVRTA